MTNKEALNLVNSIHHKVIEYDCDCNVCWFVYVPLDHEVKQVLKQLGKNDNWIQQHKETDLEREGLFDLTKIGFEYSDWWESDTGFSWINSSSNKKKTLSH